VTSHEASGNRVAPLTIFSIIYTSQSKVDLYIKFYQASIP